MNITNEIQTAHKKPKCTTLRIKDLIYNGARSAVNEKSDKCSQQEDETNLQDQLFVVSRKDVSERLPRMHEPHERGVWSTEKMTQ